MHDFTQHDLEPARAKRRRFAKKIATKRRDEHLRRTHWNPVTGLSDVDCVCELSDFFFEKKTLGCGCSKRKHGQPRVQAGWPSCKHARDHVYDWRDEVRALRISVRSGRGLDEAESREYKRGGKDKPYRIEMRSPDSYLESMRDWRTWGRYHTERDRDRALATMRKKQYPGLRFEYRAA